MRAGCGGRRRGDRFARCIAAALAAIFVAWHGSFGNAAAATADTGIWTQAIAAHTTLSLRALTFGTHRDLVNSAINPQNRLEIPATEANLHIRLDAAGNLGPFEASVRPRAEFGRVAWDEGRLDGEDNGEARTYLHEWRLRWRGDENLFLSCGRADLQWGPSSLLSPSNPFHSGNGRNTPKLETPGAEYAFVEWLPAQAWTVTVIANVDQGRRDLRGTFERTYAAKIDYLMDRRYLSVIPAVREDGDARCGFFGSWHLTDSTILHTEGGCAQDDTEALAGCSHTFADGPTITVEYFYNGGGDPDAPMPALMAAPTRETDFRESFYRRNYLFVQLSETDIFDRFDLLLRWTRNLDDDSGLVMAHAEFGMGNHARLFTTVTFLSGSTNDEFGNLLEYAVAGGVEILF